MAAVGQARTGVIQQGPGGREAARAEGVPAGGARRVWGRAAARTLSAFELAAASLSLVLALAVPGGPAGATGSKAVKISTAKVGELASAFLSSLLVARSRRATAHDGAWTAEKAQKAQTTEQTKSAEPGMVSGA